MAAPAVIDAFAAAMNRLGPFGPAPKFAIAVSGGADSTALALLTQIWAARNNASLIALIVDHGLRENAAAEARLTQTRLAARGITARIITLDHLPTGARLQETARIARHAALAAAARAEGALFLLLGHHAADQAETAAMRAMRGPFGLEAMPAWSARHDSLLLRPLLATHPAALRDFLRALDMKWLEDPSNQDRTFERVRIRQAGTTGQPADPAARRQTEHATAEFLARHVLIRPEGFAVIAAAAAPPAALAALLRIIGGAAYPPNRKSVETLAAALRPATLGGVRLQKTARLGGGWLLAREPAGLAAEIPALAGAVWDNRFRLQTGMAGARFGALGAGAAMLRKSTGLPSLVLQGMPALRLGGQMFIPATLFTPPAPAAPHMFAT
jgi:tRNA(Ile)-lysidine synthase